MYIEVGKIVGVWGVKGWVKLHSYTRNRGDIASYATWYLSKAERNKPITLSADAVVDEIEVLNCRPQGQSVVASLAGVDSRDSAAQLTGYSILVKQSDLPSLADEEFYWHELIGLTVFNGDAELGVIKAIMETGANDVLVITPKVAEPEVCVDIDSESIKSSASTNSQDERPDILIPYVDAVVQDVDLAARAMHVDWDLSYLDD